MAVVNEETFLKVRLPCIGISGVEQLARIGDVGKGVIVFFLGNGVRKVARGVDITIEDVDDAVTCLLSSEVGCEDGGNIWVVGETVMLR